MMNKFTHTANARTLRTIAGAALLAGATAPALAAPASAGRETPSDTEIAGAIGTDLMFNQSVDADKIDIDVETGIATLNGRVRTLAAKRRAIDTAQSIRGVRSVVDRLTVRQTNRTDRQILREIREMISKNPATDSYELRYEVDDADVILTGMVDSRAEKMLAEDLAAQVRGVRSINNDIRVELVGDRLDSEIRNDIVERFKRDTRVDALPIDVEVKDGVVTLTGATGSAAERLHAVDLAYVRGVEHVHADELFVTFAITDDKLKSYEEAPNFTNEDVVESVEGALRMDPRVEASDVEVEAHEGHVTLAGVVPTISAFDAAERAARYTAGVERVTNLVAVRVDGWTDDSRLAKEVRDAIERDSMLDTDDIVVVASDGVVTLTGTVSTDYQKRHATTVVSRIRGVTDIRNNIDAEREWTWQPDDEISEDIRDELFWSPYVDADQVTVLVEEGIAILSGTVDSYDEIEAAIKNAYEGGAKEVRSRLVH